MSILRHAANSDAFESVTPSCARISWIRNRACARRSAFSLTSICSRTCLTCLDLDFSGLYPVPRPYLKRPFASLAESTRSRSCLHSSQPSFGVRALLSLSLISRIYHAKLRGAFGWKSPEWDINAGYRVASLGGHGGPWALLSGTVADTVAATCINGLR